MKRNRSSLMILVLATGTFAAEAHAQQAGSTINRVNDFYATVQVPTLSTQLFLADDAPENQALRKLVLDAPKNPQQFAGKRIAILATDGVEELELTVPYRYFADRGATVHLISPRAPKYPSKFGIAMPEIRSTHILTVHYIENGGWFKIDRFLGEATSAEYDAVFVPGGAWNPDALRAVPEALTFIKESFGAGKPLASLCHGPLVLVNAGILAGKKATAWWTVQQDIKNAGATVIDAGVVTDGNLMTSRYPGDLPELLEAFGNAVAKTKVGAK